MNTSNWVLVRVVAVWAMGFATGWLVNDDKDTVIENPCAEHEVGVWADYPDETACVADTDHASHQGG